MISVQQAMRIDFPKATSDMRVAAVEGLLVRYGFVVLTDLAPDGIVTLGSALEAGHLLLADCVAEIPPASVETPLCEAMEMMNHAVCDVVPVIEDGVCVGVLHRADAAQALHCYGEELSREVELKTEELRRLNRSLQAEIQQRMATENRLKESEQRLQMIVDMVPAMICIHDVGNEIIFVNKYGNETFGVETGAYVSRYMCVEEWKRMKALFQRDLETNASPSFRNSTLVKKDGTEVPIQTINAPFLINGNRHVLSVSLDVSSTVLLEQEVREREAVFQQIAASVNEIFWLIDVRQRRLIYVSPAYEKVFQYPADEAYCATIDLLEQRLHVHPDDVTGLRKRLELLLSGKPLEEEFEVRVTRADGENVWVRTKASLIHDNAGQLYRIAAVSKDITPFRESAEKERLHKEQLAQADKLASLGVLVSGVAHEINNPNNFIMLNTPLLRQVWDSAAPILASYYRENGDFKLGGLNYSRMAERVPQLFQGLENGARRIQRIVADLKNYARKDSESFNSRIDMNSVVEAAIGLVKNQLTKSTSNFRCRLSPVALYVKGNFQKLEQVLVNLLQNACDALERNDALIEVRVRLEDKMCVIEVEDSGLGIPPENLTKLTDPFFSTKRERGGTGLGLGVSEEIIKRHNGQMEFKSEVGRGTLVKVAVPVSDGNV